MATKRLQCSLAEIRMLQFSLSKFTLHRDAIRRNIFHANCSHKRKNAHRKLALFNFAQKSVGARHCPGIFSCVPLLMASMRSAWQHWMTFTKRCTHFICMAFSSAFVQILVCSFLASRQLFSRIERARTEEKQFLQVTIKERHTQTLRENMKGFKFLCCRSKVNTVSSSQQPWLNEFAEEYFISLVCFHSNNNRFDFSLILAGYTSNTLTNVNVGVGKSSLDAHSHFRQSGEFGCKIFLSFENA